VLGLAHPCRRVKKVPLACGFLGETKRRAEYSAFLSSFLMTNSSSSFMVATRLI